VRDYFTSETYYDLLETQKKLYDLSRKGYGFRRLIPMITSDRNILLAHREIKANKGSNTPAINPITVKDIKEAEVTEYIKSIRASLIEYKPNKIRRKEIPKPDGGIRVLGIADYADKIKDQALKQILEPIAEARFHGNSYGFRPGRNTHQAIERAKNYMNFGYHFAVDIDVRKFFDSVDHKILIQKVWKIGIRDRQVIEILKRRLKVIVVDPIKKIEYRSTLGTPQGGVISPLLANIYLNDFDWWMHKQYLGHPDRGKKEANLRPGLSIRYADDILILCRNRADAEWWMEKTREYMREHLKLELSQEKTKILNLKKEKLCYLGIEIKVNRKGLTVYHLKSKDVRDKIQKLTISNIPKTKSEAIITKIQLIIKMILELLPQTKKFRQLIGKVHLYNSVIRGIHEYYNITSEISPEMWKIYLRCKAQLKALYYRTGKPNECRGAPYDPRRIFIAGIRIIPIWEVKRKNGRLLKLDHNYYANENHLNSLVKRELYKLAKNPVIGRTVEYNDNRISKYSMQNGKDYVTGLFLKAEEVHCHHIIRIANGGNDKFSNLVIVSSVTHRLIHSETLTYPEWFTPRMKDKLKRLWELSNTGHKRQHE
jgi:group II intron reverse transcriptase/maturase